MTAATTATNAVRRHSSRPCWRSRWPAKETPGRCGSKYGQPRKPRTASGQVHSRGGGASTCSGSMKYISAIGFISTPRWHSTRSSNGGVSASQWRRLSLSRELKLNGDDDFPADFRKPQFTHRLLYPGRSFLSARKRDNGCFRRILNSRKIDCQRFRTGAIVASRCPACRPVARSKMLGSHAYRANVRPRTEGRAMYPTSAIPRHVGAVCANVGRFCGHIPVAGEPGEARRACRALRRRGERAAKVCEHRSAGGVYSIRT